MRGRAAHGTGRPPAPASLSQRRPDGTETGVSTECRADHHDSQVPIRALRCPDARCAQARGGVRAACTPWQPRVRVPALMRSPERSGGPRSATAAARVRAVLLPARSQSSSTQAARAASARGAASEVCQSYGWPQWPWRERERPRAHGAGPEPGRRDSWARVCQLRRRAQAPARRQRAPASERAGAAAWRWRWRVRRGASAPRRRRPVAHAAPRV